MQFTRSPQAIARTPCEYRFHAFDGTEIFYRHWQGASASTPNKAILLFHRGHEHGGRMVHVVPELNLLDYDFFAWDARGLGRSSGPRGDAPHFGSLIKDVDAFVRHVSNQHGVAIDNMLVIAQSFAAVVVAAWVHDFAPPLRGMVLASPAFKIKLYVPLARPLLGMMQRLRGKFFVNSYVKARYLTHDAQRIASYEADPLITRPIAAHILLDLYSTAERITTDAGAIQVPTQLLISGADWVVSQPAQQAFFNRLGSRVKQCHVLPGFYHDTLGERDRSLAFDRIRPFIQDMFRVRRQRPDLLDADKAGFTKDEFDRISAPPRSIAATLYWKMSRFWIRVGATLSTGMRISAATGFDSGSTLDYVYRNVAGGVTPLGKMVDRIYLDSIGWRGIRYRKTHLESLINNAADLLEADRVPVNVVDIAAGHGRYILDAFGERGERVDHILLRDYSQRNVDAGRKLIASRRMTRYAEFVQADAFDRASLAAITPAPTLAVVSGLYELFPSNDLIRNSLAGLADAMPSGSYLVYTCQPWHPQLELIARSLTSHRQGDAWVMRRRTQAEMDQLCDHAGFDKIDQLADEWGIFTVSLARKR